MKLFCVDTCVLIDIANRLYDEEDDLITTLEYLVTSEKIKLIFPEIVKEEWDRNKQKEVKDKLTTIIKESTKKISCLKPYLDAEDAKILNDYLVSIRGSRSKLTKMVDYNISRIEKLFENPYNVSISIEHSHRHIAAEQAYRKKKPFTASKNSMADALILISAVDYAQKADLELYFATLNTKDFSGVNDNDLHQDLKELIQNGINERRDYNNFKMNYTINLATTLNYLYQDILSKELEKSIDESLITYNRLPDTMPCVRCDKDAYGSYKHSMYGGLTWQYYCPSCKSNYDTGDFYD